MARLFDDAATEYLEDDSAPVTAVPFTISAWFYSDDVAIAQGVVVISDKDVTAEKFELFIAGQVGGDPVRAITQGGGGVGIASSTTGYSANTWHHGCAVFNSTTSRSAFIDGGSKGTNTNSVTPSGMDRISIGRRGDASPSNYFSGRIAEAAIWNVAISDAEVAVLATGVAPPFVRPNALIFYAPLYRGRSSTGGDDYDIVGGLTLTDNNTVTVADHPPIFRHARPSLTMDYLTTAQMRAATQHTDFPTSRMFLEPKPVLV